MKIVKNIQFRSISKEVLDEFTITLNLFSYFQVN